MHLRKATKSLPVLVSLLPIIVLAQSNGGDGSSTSFLQDYVNFLNQSGYTSVANALVQANQTESGQEWLSKVGQQVQNEGGNVGSPWTVFVPNNQACTSLAFDFGLMKLMSRIVQSVPDSVTQNTTLLSEILSYHFVYGNLQNITAANGGGGGGGGGGATSSTEGPSSTMSPSQTSSGAFSAPTSSGAGQPSLPGQGGSDGGPGGPAQTGTETPPSTPSSFAARELFEKFLRRDSSNPNSGSNSGLQLLSGIYPNTTIGRTLLNDSSLVQLEGNKSQVLVWTRSGEDGNVTILNQP
jgi:hypothetical protein